MNKEFHKTELPVMLTASDVVQEAKNIKSFFFDYSLVIEPGQFVMLWLPNHDAKPFAISYHKKSEFGITSHAIGEFTRKLDLLKRGAKVGVSGPYGNGFTIKKDACIVGGGMGMAPLATLIDVLKNPLIINGARAKDCLIYLKRYRKKNIIATTDDGSFGRRGFATDALEDVLKEKRFDVVYTCGPEIMMKNVLEICNKHRIECEASLERYMSCGFGICGKCAINGRLVCVDGPVFNSRQLNKIADFGRFARLKSGRKVTLNEYFCGRKG